MSCHATRLLPLNRLGVRLFLMVTAAILAITVAADAWRLRREHRRVLDQLQREASLVAEAIEAQVVSLLRAFDDPTLGSMLEDIRRAKGAVCAAVYSLQGDRLQVAFEPGTTAPNLDVCPPSVMPLPLAEAVFASRGLTGTYNLQLPLTPNDLPSAILKLVFEEARVSEPLLQLRNSILVERLLALAAIGLLLWIGIAASVTRPIRRLIRGAEAIGAGRLDVRIAPIGSGEIGDLARAFNRMTERLQDAEQERNRAEEKRLLLEGQVRHADKLAAVGKLAGVMAHEIGTPLNVILGRTRILARGLPEGDPRIHDAEIVRSQVNRIADVVQRILKYSRPSRPRRDPVDLRAIVRDAVTILAPEAAARSIHLEARLPAELPPLVADAEGLMQVLVNLLMNALAALEKGGNIRVEVSARLSEASPGIELAVADSGVGIRPEHLPRIFDPFFSTKDGGGTGLGLSICRDIVTEHGGTITAESRPGTGATFRVWLPAGASEVHHV